MSKSVTIDELMNMWTEDAEIDQLEPDNELLKIPKLHAKYLRILAHHNLMIKKIMTDYNRMKKLKWEYYSGDLNNPEDLEKYDLEPITKKILRQDIPTYLDSDTELTNLLLKKMLHEEIVNACTLIIKEINSRTWQLRSFIDWHKFQNAN